MSVPLEKVRFLVVDDNLHVLNIVKTVLRGLGAVHVFDARTKKDALEHLRNEAIDIVILDYMLGEEDGVEFLRQLRTDPKSPTPFVPVIMLTSHTEKSRVEAARDAGANAFCSKPVTPADIMRKVAAVIDRPLPFVRTGDYTGPDRRRREESLRGPDRRRDE
ncbi:MAG TPA: response regulator [Caulobacteraceae bacterium]|nr:response regulator [Caulobacteraceae bacterium]